MSWPPRRATSMTALPESGVDLTSLRNGVETMPPAQPRAIDAELVGTGEIDHDAARTGLPGTGSVRELLGLGRQPVQARDRQEAVPVGQRSLMLAAELRPVLLEGYLVDVLDRHGSMPSTGRRSASAALLGHRDKPRAGGPYSGRAAKRIRRVALRRLA